MSHPINTIIAEAKLEREISRKALYISPLFTAKECTNLDDLDIDNSFAEQKYLDSAERAKRDGRSN